VHTSSTARSASRGPTASLPTSLGR